MTSRASIVSVLVVLLCSTLPVRAADLTAEQLQTQFSTTVQPFLTANCVSCHSGPRPKGQVDLTAYPTVESVVKAHQQWGMVLELIKSKEMPPADAKTHPTDAQRAEMVAWIEGLTKLESQKNAGDPGLVLARRLSNAEYDYTIRDLTGVDMRPTKEFPVDPANEAGFDNSGESLAMSPSLVQKYLDAARLVSEHLVFTPNGLRFAPHPMVTEVDRDKYVVHRIVDFYKQQRLDYADYFEAAWRFQNRADLGKPQMTLAEAAAEARLSPKYLATVWAALTNADEEIGPIAELRLKFNDLPKPHDGKEAARLRDGCVQMRDFVVQLRAKVAADFRNLPGRGIAPGSQTLVLWKNRQFAANRMSYAGGALDLYDAAPDETISPAMMIPNDEPSRQRYEEAFKRFCAIFPDTFVVWERARMYLTNRREIASDLRGHRLLTAGFHSQMGYFRDDAPLYQLMLDDSQQRELDELWRELDFVALAPIRQHLQFLWYERAESRFMLDPQFDFARPESHDATSDEKMTKLAELYYAKAEQSGNNEVILQAIRDHFEGITTSIRALEKSKLEAEPRHIESLLQFAARAYRRPLKPVERDGVKTFYQSLRSDAALSHEDAIRDTVTSILMSPYFLYRVDPSDPSPGTRPLTDYELASRLSYFLWSSMPDEQLMSRAAAGELRKPEVLVAEAKRMLRDERVRALAMEFAGNWLDIRRFEEHNAVDRERFPEFTNELRSAMFEEPIRFFAELVQSNQSVLELLYGDYTFVNPILAEHYGIDWAATEGAGDEWVRVDGAGKYHRGGMLPMSVFLTKNAPGLRTSPVKRGYWVVRRLLGEVIPAPPPNVPDLPSDETKLGDLTLAQALAKHREDPSCGVCHERFDSFGLVFESYGPVGEWRTRDLADRPVQTVATFPRNGGEGEGLEGLRAYIRQHRQDDFIDNLARKLLVYSLGRGLILSDEPLVREMAEKLKENEYRFGVLVESIVTSPQFLTRRGSGMAAR